LREGTFAPIANLVTKFGEESYFHQMCIDGWLKALDDEELADLRVALGRRLPLMVAWFADNAGEDALIEGGVRTQSLTDVKAGLIEDVLNKMASITDIPDDELRSMTVGNPAEHWDRRRRRTGDSEMPPRLWESIVPTSEEALIARRPLAVSVDDNIDLFGKIKKDETEPQFS